MADELKQAWSPTREEVKDNLLNLALLGGGAGSLYGTRKGLQYGFVKLMDTLGQGNIGIESKYASAPKMVQAWNNYLNVLQPGETPISASFRVGKQLLKGADLEILSAENSIRHFENQLRDAKLNPQQRVNIENELRARKFGPGGLEDRKVAVANKYKVFGFKPPQYEMKHAQHTIAKVTPLMGKVEKSLAPYIGQNIMATEMSREKMNMFKGYAIRDRRVQYVSSLLADGKYKEAQNAAKNGYYINRGELVKPFKDVKGIPLNPKGKTLGGMKLKKLPKAEWLIKNGIKVPTYGLGFVPTTPFLDKKMEFITGRHYQQMKFIKHGKGYVKAGLSLIDSSDYSWGRGTQMIEKYMLGAKPVVNIGEATFNMPRNITVETQNQYRKRIGLRPAYYKKEVGYGRTKELYKKPTRSIAKKLAEAAGSPLKLAVRIASRGRIKI